MICPNCLTDIETFDADSPHREQPGYRCPACKLSVPDKYVEDCKVYPPIVFFLMDLPGHGKCQYIARLFVEFETIGKEWTDFFYTPLQEQLLATVRKQQHAVEESKTVESARKLFIKPVIIQLNGVPDLGNCHLLMYDSAVEQEPDKNDLRFLKGYIGHNAVVILLLSLHDVNSPTELTDFLTRYMENMTRFGGSAKEQTLIVSLTKGDTLLDMEKLPDQVFHAIHGDKIICPEGVDETTELSGIIETWLGIQDETMNFVRRAKADFKEVVYTVTTANPPRDDDETSPRVLPNVWSPLKIAWKAQQPLLKEAKRKQTRERIGRAAKESAVELSSRILGGVLGLIEGALWGAVLWAIAGGLAVFFEQKSFILNSVLQSAVGLGKWGIIWGSLIWMIAGVSDASKGVGSYTRTNVRFGAVTGLILNGIIAGVIWGIALTLFVILKENASLSRDLMTDNAMTGLGYGIKLGAVLGAFWGLEVSRSSSMEIRALSGAVLSLTVGAIVGVLIDIFTGMNQIQTSMIWGGTAIGVFAFWALARCKA